MHMHVRISRRKLCIASCNPQEETAAAMAGLAVAPPPLSRTESQALADALQVPVAEVRAARAAEATLETRRQLVLEQLQAAAAPPLSLLDPGTLRFALEQARQNGVGGSEVEAAELTLRAATELEPPLVAMLEQLGIAPAPLVQANLRSIAAVGADAGALRAALGAAEAAALLDAAQRAAVTPSELEVAVARLVVGERLGAGSFGTVSRHHIWLQPASYMVAAGIIYGYSLHHIWLQPSSYVVTASDIYGYSLHHMWLQPPTSMVTAFIIFGYSLHHL
jgi:hypothetical protein